MIIVNNRNNNNIFKKDLWGLTRNNKIYNNFLRIRKRLETLNYDNDLIYMYSNNPLNNPLNDPLHDPLNDPLNVTN